jgi:hypothetical protein
VLVFLAVSLPLFGASLFGVAGGGCFGAAHLGSQLVGFSFSGGEGYSRRLEVNLTVPVAGAHPVSHHLRRLWKMRVACRIGSCMGS